MARTLPVETESFTRLLRRGAKDLKRNRDRKLHTAVKHQGGAQGLKGSDPIETKDLTRLLSTKLKRRLKRRPTKNNSCMKR